MGYDHTGMENYNKLLQDSRNRDDVGVNKHMRVSQPPTSRLGFKGKKVAKKDLVEITEKLTKAAKHNPQLQKAAQNLNKYAPVGYSKTKPAPTKQEDSAELRVLQNLILEYKKNNSNISSVSAKPIFSEDELREKIKQERMNKIANDMKIPQYSKFGEEAQSKLSNEPG